MSLTYLGNLGIGAVIPGVGAALAVSLQDIQARLDALLTFAPAPIDFAAQLEVALKAVASIQASIALGIEPPSISAQIALVAALVAALEVQVRILARINSLFLTAGIDLWAYDGAVNALGGALTTALTGGLPSGGTGATHCNALILATSIGATWGAMGEVFKVSP